MDDPDHAWAIDTEPTTLIALWPGDSPPTATEVVAAFEAHAGGRVRVIEDVDLETSDPDTVILWSELVDVPGREHPVLIWSETASELPPGELDPAAHACRWVLGVESVLETEDPLDSFAALVRLIADPFEDIPAILDLNTERWHPRESLDRNFTDKLDPPASVLWIIHLVQPDEDRGSADGAWIHTHGLGRCALPELEMLDVAEGSLDPAVALLETIAGRLLETAPPTPGEPFAVGPDLEVTFDRATDDNTHAGVRAVVRGASRVLESVGEGRGAFYVSTRETQRQARLASRGWSELAGIFSTLHGLAQFFIKAGIRSAADGDQREHLWFALRRIEDDRAEAELINPPKLAALSKGDVVWLEREEVSDWTVATRVGSFGPAEVDALRRAVPSITGGEQAPP